MSLQVPSGLIVSVSGGGLVSGTTPPGFAYPIPTVIVGANGASASGNHSITDFSGALNVNISGGNLVANVSGDSVSIASGNVSINSGTVQIAASGYIVLNTVYNTSGTAGSGLLGVALLAQDFATGNFFPAVGVSGALYISEQSGDGIPVESGGILPVQIVSGNVFIASGNIDVVSGNVQIFGSGFTALTMLSGNVGVSGQVISGAWVQPVLPVIYDFSGLAYYPLSTPTSGRAVLSIGIVDPAAPNNFVNVNAGGVLADAVSNNFIALPAKAYVSLFNGTSVDRQRSVTGSSGGSLGVTAVQMVGYSYSHIAGAAAITNIKSGAAFLHTININDYTSGQGFTVYDSSSGIGGNTIAAPNPFAGGLTPTDLAPSSLLFDILVTSGLVVSTSGSGWDITVTWRTATS